LVTRHSSLVTLTLSRQGCTIRSTSHPTRPTAERATAMDKQSYDKQKYEREIEEILAKYEKEVEHKEGVEKPARQLGSFPPANARRPRRAWSLGFPSINWRRLSAGQSLLSDI